MAGRAASRTRSRSRSTSLEASGAYQQSRGTATFRVMWRSARLQVESDASGHAAGHADLHRLVDGPLLRVEQRDTVIALVVHVEDHRLTGPADALMIRAQDAYAVVLGPRKIVVSAFADMTASASIDRAQRWTVVIQSERR